MECKFNYSSSSISVMIPTTTQIICHIMENCLGECFPNREERDFIRNNYSPNWLVNSGVFGSVDTAKIENVSSIYKNIK